MAVFDVVVNNADRKGGHVLAMTDGHRYGVDHGVTFHVEHKLRTVLWGWAGASRCTDGGAGAGAYSRPLDGDLGERAAPSLLDRTGGRGARAAPRAAAGDPRYPVPSATGPASRGRRSDSGLEPWPLGVRPRSG